jgi:hypothetical protein
MPSPTFTERRLYRNAALLMGFQSALGTPVSDFTTALTRAMWLREYDLDPGDEKGDDQGTIGTARKRLEARYLIQRLPKARLLGGATPKNVEWALRSWGGPWTGGPAFTLDVKENINEFATLGLVEKIVPGATNPQRLIRLKDAWVNRVRLSQVSGVSTLDLEAWAVARTFDKTAMSALGGITLPATAPGYMPPAIDVFAPHQFRLYRDPAGANVSIAVRELELDMEHGTLHESFNDIEPQIVKEGYTSIKYRLRGVWMAETHTLQDDLETSPPVFKRFRAEWVSGAKSLIIDARNLDWTPSITGWRENRFAEFLIEGEAYLDSTDNWLTVTLTP